MGGSSDFFRLSAGVKPDASLAARESLVAGIQKGRTQANATLETITLVVLREGATKTAGGVYKTVSVEGRDREQGDVLWVPASVVVVVVLVLGSPTSLALLAPVLEDLVPERSKTSGNLTD